MQPPLSLPDFLVIGTAKAGTTSLYRYLKTHPEVYLSPIKEPKYFAFPDTPPVFVGPHRNTPVVWRLEDYRRLFESRPGDSVAGEMSPQYLYVECSPGAIRTLVPNVKLVAILRDPTNRAHSHFCHNRRDGIEPLSDFAAALAAEDQRIAQGWWSSFHYRNRGYYARQLKRYLALFPRQQVLIQLHDDMLADCPAVLRKICAFLGIDEDHVFDTRERDNVSMGIPRSPLLRRFFRSAGPAKSMVRTVLPGGTRSSLFRVLSRLVLAPKPELHPEVRARLVSEFTADILELQDIVERDLSSWLRC